MVQLYNDEMYINASYFFLFYVYLYFTFYTIYNCVMYSAEDYR